jgi:hypothetical protein
MIDSDQSILPEKCCAKCGFLYGVVSNCVNPNDAIFDPDLLRSTDYTTKNPYEYAYPRGIISSKLYNYRVRLIGPGRSQTETLKINYYSWMDVRTFCCYWKVFDDFHILWSYGRKIDDDDRLLTVPGESDNIISIFRTDRKDCNYFFQYLPGFSPQQHAERCQEEIRARQILENEERLIKLSIEAEDRRQQDEIRWQERAHRLTNRLILIAIIIAFIVGVIQPLITFYWPRIDSILSNLFMK